MSTTNPIDLIQPMPPASAEADAQRSVLDRIGISASVLCAIHCMAAPFLLLLLPAAGSVWSHPAVHWVLAVLVVPLALWVLFKGYTKHRNKVTFVAASAGALLILAGLIAPMIQSQPIVSLPVPAFLGDLGGPAAATPACTDVCCPTITQDAAGVSTLAMPPGGLLTLIGSFFLVTAHGSNLIACRGSAKRHGCGDDGCGCPA